MNTATPTSDGNTRLFKPFLDPVDMIACFAADTTIGEVNETAAAQGLYFPLYCDRNKSLREHFASAEYTSASARFGAYVDNVPGMNWQLPSGQVARVGERVVKSTTGYDLLRFLLHSGNRFGTAVDYVVRLRPLASEEYAGAFSGSTAALNALAQDMLRSSWSHWIDCFDLAISPEQGPKIELCGHCLDGEKQIFFKHFKTLAATHQIQFKEAPYAHQIPLPALTINTVPSRCQAIASECVQLFGGSARVLLVNGIVFANPENPPSADWLKRIHSEVTEHGGHLFGREIPAKPYSSIEQSWVDTLTSHWI